MSRFLKESFKSLSCYVPGEQFQDRKFIKLNTNESPYPPSPLVAARAGEAARNLQLYSDPESAALRQAIAGLHHVKTENVIVSNGSDEALNFAFLAFGDASHPFVFADITYGFYKVLCDVNGIPYVLVPLREDFTARAEDYPDSGHIVLANPNAPTGIPMPTEEVEKIVLANPDRIVIVDEAYADFSEGDCLSLAMKYDNVLIVRTFSKSRSMAGARLGYAIGNEKLIGDLKLVKDSIDPYNVNLMTSAAGIAAIEENGYYTENCQRIVRTRRETAEKLGSLGFTVLPSGTNFVFARHPSVGGEDLYRMLKEKGVLVRHFNTGRIRDFNRITIGSEEQMDCFFRILGECLNKL